MAAEDREDCSASEQAGCDDLDYGSIHGRGVIPGAGGGGGIAGSPPSTEPVPPPGAHLLNLFAAGGVI